MGSNNLFKELEKQNLPGVKRAISLYPNCVAAKGPDNRTALHVAAVQGLPQFVKELLLHGAAVDIGDRDGNLPVHLAAEQGSLECLSELLTGQARKLTVKQKNKDGQTPLHMAVRAGHIAVVAKLLENGARPDAKDKAGTTPVDLVPHDLAEAMLPMLLGAPTETPAPAATGVRASMDTPMPAYRVAPPAPLAVAGGNNASAPSAKSNLPTTPASARGSGIGSAIPASARTPPVFPPSGSTPGSATVRLGRQTSGRSGADAPPAMTMPAASSASFSGPAGAGGLGQKMQACDAAILVLQQQIREAHEKLERLDAVAVTQVETAGQVETCINQTGTQMRTLEDLETRVIFQEEKAKDMRARVEKLEESERRMSSDIRLAQERQEASMRPLHDALARTNIEVRELASQLSSMQLSRRAGGSGGVAHDSLVSEVSSLRRQLDGLTPVLTLATAATTDVRLLNQRMDALQHQQNQPSMAGGASAGAVALLEQQVVQMQAQIQLLQMPVATLSQQHNELVNKVAGLIEQATANQHRAPVPASLAAGGVPRERDEELSDHVTRALDTALQSLQKMEAKQEENARQLVVLQQQLAAAGIGTAAGVADSAAMSPSTPNGPTLRGAATPADGDLPPRNLARGPSMGSAGGIMQERAAANSAADLRNELEALKEALVEAKKEAATNGGAVRRELQRALEDMQQRFGEHASEVKTREANIAKLREAAMMDEAERRATHALEDKVNKRFDKLEAHVGYLQHRLEVVEEQVAGLTAVPPNSSRPDSPAVASPSTFALRSQHAHLGGRTGPGPVSENCASTSTHLQPACASPAMALASAHCQSSCAGPSSRAMAPPSPAYGLDSTLGAVPLGGGMQAQTAATSTSLRYSEGAPLQPTATSAPTLFLPPGAAAMMQPSLDIQRVAAAGSPSRTVLHSAAVEAHRLSQQRPAQHCLISRPSAMAAGPVPLSYSGHNAAVGEAGAKKEEPPMCGVYCPVQ